MKYLNILVIAVVLLVIILSAADFIFTGHFDPLASSGAACAPIVSAALYRWASRPAPRPVVSRKVR